MELLSPAGNYEALVAAVQSGADAVYLGFGGFNARRSAGNFTDGEFERAVEYCHARGVKVHVTLNTLIKQHELDGFAGAALQAARAGADAVIVQDLGGARLVKELCPGLKLHMSTQAACFSAAGVRFAAAQGYDRVVLARECSLDEIALCARQGVEIETFAHGALCVCFSGQCLMSSLVGGRSGNRGMCAQPCRLSYELTGAHAARGCLLSPRDIMMLGELKALSDAGVCSLKIEGRLKRPEYVAEVTRVYRRALDALSEHPERYAPDADDELALRQIFNRGGFSRAYLDARFRDSDITDPTRPNNMGVRVGEVEGSRAGRLRLRLDTALDAGDQISLRLGDRETGFELKQALGRGRVELDVPELRKYPQALSGAEVYRAASSAQLERAHEACQGEHRSAPVDMRAELRVGGAAQLELRAAGDARNADIADVCVRVKGAQVSPARKAPLGQDAVRAQLGKLGGTPLRAGQVELELDADAFLPVSALNELRRAAVDAFEAEVLRRRRGCPPPGEARREASSERRAPHAARPLVIVQSGDMADAALGDALYWEPERVDRASLEREFAGRPQGARVYLRLPVMLTSAELDGMVGFAREHGAELAGCVLTNIAQLAERLPGELVGDANLSAWNARTLELLRALGLKRQTASLELSCAEISAADCEGLERELIVYGRATLMTLRHCPVNARSRARHDECRLCDGGRGLKNCALVDRKRVSFPLARYRGASGCYAQVLNSAPHDLIGRLGRLPACDAVRLIFTNESAPERRALAQEARAATEALAQGRACAHAGVPGATAGHYFRGVE